MGCASLHWAAKIGYLKVAEILIQNGVRVDIKDNRGYTPLDYATEYKHTQVVEKLTEIAEKLIAALPWYKRMSYWIAAHPYKTTAMTLATGGLLYTGMRYFTSAEVMPKTL